jgi:hypothetical protein
LNPTAGMQNPLIIFDGFWVIFAKTLEEFML